MGRVEIKRATIRDMSFIAASLSDDDHQEIHCQFSNISARDIALVSFHGSPEWAFTAWLDGQPVLAFGLAMEHPRRAYAWAWGTARKGRAIPAATRYLLEVIKPEVLSGGIMRIHADSMASHSRAHSWLRRIGAQKESEMPHFGKNGETFYRFAWIRSNAE